MPLCIVLIALMYFILREPCPCDEEDKDKVVEGSGLMIIPIGFAIIICFIWFMCMLVNINDIFISQSFIDGCVESSYSRDSNFELSKCFIKRIFQILLGPIGWIWLLFDGS
jgi:hypothetical protein